MNTVAINEISGDTALYNVDKRFVGRVNADTGRAIIGNAFWVKERVCHDIARPGEAFRCSECGVDVSVEYDDSRLFMGDYAARFMYCPNCGARVA